MPNRDFDTGTWTDPWIETLKPLERYLFFYCWTNNHCTPAGMYYISTNRMASETGLTEKQISEILPHLSPKVEYDFSQQLLWVRNFVRKQRRGDTFLVAVSRTLEKIKPHPFLKHFSEEYHGFKIGYIEAIDSLSIGYTPVLGLGEKNKNNETAEKPKPKKAAKKAKVSLPAHFAVSDQVKEWAAKKGFDRLEEHLAAFKRKCRAKGYEYVDWDSAFMEAIREDWAKLRRNGNGGRDPTTDDDKRKELKAELKSWYSKKERKQSVIEHLDAEDSRRQEQEKDLSRIEFNIKRLEKQLC